MVDDGTDRQDEGAGVRHFGGRIKIPLQPLPVSLRPIRPDEFDTDSFQRVSVGCRQAFWLTGALIFSY